MFFFGFVAATTAAAAAYISPVEALRLPGGHIKRTRFQPHSLSADGGDDNDNDINRPEPSAPRRFTNIIDLFFIETPTEEPWVDKCTCAVTRCMYCALISFPTPHRLGGPPYPLIRQHGYPGSDPREYRATIYVDAGPSGVRWLQLARARCRRPCHGSCEARACYETRRRLGLRNRPRWKRA